MVGRCLVDTNVLVYAHGRSEPTRQRKAISVLEDLEAGGRGYLSTQVIAEFFAIATSKIAMPLAAAAAADEVRRFVDSWPVCDVTPFVVLEALRGAEQYGISYWDAQVWATARMYQLDCVVTEDVQCADVLEGVRFVNPFGE